MEHNGEPTCGQRSNQIVLTLFGFHTLFSTLRHKPLVRVPEYHPILRGNTPNIRVIIAQWRCYLHLIDARATLARFLLKCNRIRGKYDHNFDTILLHTFLVLCFMNDQQLVKK